MSTPKYTGRLFPVEVGQLITVAGKILNNPNRFDVELTSSNGHGNDSGDIQLHISVRFQAAEPVVVRNTHSRGVGWATEERRENLFPFNVLNPFNRGGDFKLEIFVDQSAFFISIDDKPYCTFVHRLPINAIQTINIWRDVESVHQVNQTSAQARPWPGVSPLHFEAFAPKQFNPGNVVVITAIPRGNSNGDFSVNFFDGSNRFRSHFHVRPFLNSRRVVLNSQNESSNWMQEISFCPNPFPFNINQVYKMAIAITNTEFQVAANGQRIGNMSFRDHPQRLLGSLTGIGFICLNGLSMEVQSVDFKTMDCVCNGFENFSRI